MTCSQTDCVNQILSADWETEEKRSSDLTFFDVNSKGTCVCKMEFKPGTAEHWKCIG